MNRAARDEMEALSRRHLRHGWWLLLLFLSLGLVLESLHGFKVRWYLDVGNSTRRHMFTLAHAHGTLLAVIQIVFALTLPRLESARSRWMGVASRSLDAASLALPAGFFLGGLYIYSGDPGLGVLLVPVGAVLLFLAVLLTAKGIGRR